MAHESTYTSGLAHFVDESIQRWAKQKKKTLEPKLKMNFEAVTNRDYRIKTWKKDEGVGWRSRTWIGFVRIKVWAFYALILDTVLRAGKIPFTIEPSPYDESDIDTEERDERIERMTKKIQYQLKARHADRHYMLKWLSGGYYGMAFSKFNVEAVKSTEFKQVSVDAGQSAQFLTPEEQSELIRFELVTESNDIPGHNYVSVWNMVWDMEGEFNEGSGYAEVIRSSAFDLKSLKGKPGYIDRAIDEVIKKKRHEDGNDPAEPVGEHPAKLDIDERVKKFIRYECWMLIPRKFAEAFEKELKSKDTDIARLRLAVEIEDAEESGDDIEVLIEIVDKEIIRYVVNDSGRRAHHMWVVEKNLDESTGQGIADNMEDVQSSLVGMIRAFEDNKKLSANVTTVIKARYFSNPDQLDDIIPGKKYDISDATDDVRKAIMPIVFPDVGESLMTGIAMMRQYSDDVSMIPTILHGFNLPSTKPDTLGEAQLLTAQAGKYIGQAIRNNDEMFIEPEIREMYEYNMLFDDDESIKVNAKVSANGFTSFQNKEIRGERMKGVLGAFVTNEFLNPYIKVKPHLDIIYESLDEDPDKFINTEEELAEINQQRADQQAKAQQDAIAIAQGEREHEAGLKAAGSAQEHGQDMEAEELKHELGMEAEEVKQDLEDESAELEHDLKSDEIEQEHINTLEEETLKARLDRIYKPETQGGS